MPKINDSISPDEQKVAITAFTMALVEGVRLIGPCGVNEDQLYASVAKMIDRQDDRSQGVRLGRCGADRTKDVSTDGTVRTRVLWAEEGTVMRKTDWPVWILLLGILIQLVLLVIQFDELLGLLKEWHK